MAENRDYQKLNKDMHSMLAGTAKPKSSSGPKTTTVTIEVSEMPKKIPAGSLVEIEKVAATDLKFGDIVYMKRRDRAVLCRYVGTKGDQLEVTQQTEAGTQSIPASALLGKVIRASFDGKTREFNKDLTMSRVMLRAKVSVDKLTGK